MIGVQSKACRVQGVGETLGAAGALAVGEKEDLLEGVLVTRETNSG